MKGNRVTDIYIPKRAPVLSNETTGLYDVSRASCKVNIANWRECAANAAQRGDWKDARYCEAKAQKIRGWLEDLIEKGRVFDA